MNEEFDLEDVMEGLVEYLERFTKEVSNYVDMSRRGEEHENKNVLIEIVDGYSVIISGISSISILKPEFGLFIDNEECKVFLSDLMSSLKNSDIILLFDILEYEILEQANGWLENLTENLTQ